MTLRENNNKKTDQAWNRLHSRLEQDGLLDVKEEKTQTLFFRSPALKWAASLVILASATMFLLKSINTSDKEMLTLLNSEESSTFVTTLEDGSTVYLAKNSSLSYPKHFRKHKREVFLTGDAFFEVSKNAKAPFVIETGQVKIEVLGTSFNVISGKNAAPSLSVRTGLVKVTLKADGQSTRISAGETVLIQPDRLRTISTRDLEQFTHYRERMHFKDEQLSDILNIINRNLEGIRLEISPALENRTLTATFSNNTPESMAQLICIALNLKYSQTQNTIQIYE